MESFGKQLFYQVKVVYFDFLLNFGLLKSWSLHEFTLSKNVFYESFGAN